LTGNTEEASTNLKEALEKDAKFSEALLNLAICYTHQNKPTLTNRLISQVKTNQADHSFLKLLQEAETNFTSFSSSYSPEVKN